MLYKQTPLEPPQPTTTDRWCCAFHARKWASSFTTAFPRKAWRVRQLLAELAGHTTYGDAELELPKACLGIRSFELQKGDQDQLEHFKRDREVLIHRCGIRPDAANLFLHYCPVGSVRPRLPTGWGEGGRFDETMCYYAEGEEPSQNLGSILEHQLEEARGLLIAEISNTRRLEAFLPPNMYPRFFQFLGWEFTPDLEANDPTEGQEVSIRLGWIEDFELGQVACYNLPTWIPPYWQRDELFRSMAAWVSDNCNTPALIMGNRPTQLIAGSKVYTCVGYFVVEGLILPCIVPDKPTCLSDLLVAARFFNPSTSVELLDRHKEVFNRFWSLLKDSGEPTVPSKARYVMLPNSWAVPA